jgi:hypothetical protein
MRRRRAVNPRLLGRKLGFGQGTLCFIVRNAFRKFPEISSINNILYLELIEYYPPLRGNAPLHFYLSICLTAIICWVTYWKMEDEYGWKWEEAVVADLKHRLISLNIGRVQNFSNKVQLFRCWSGIEPTCLKYKSDTSQFNSLQLIKFSNLDTSCCSQLLRDPHCSRQYKL